MFEGILDEPVRVREGDRTRIISNLDDGKKTRYLDLTAKFTDASGAIPKGIMPDGLHPNAAGYKIWAEAIKPMLTTMMK